MEYIIIVPISLIAIALFVGGSVLVEVVNSVESWIANHSTLLCLIVLALYGLIVYALYKETETTLKKHAISKPLYWICSILRALASATYVIFFIVGIAATFRPSYSIFENALELLGFVLMLIPLYAMHFFEGIMSMEPSNGGVVVGCILSVLGSGLGVLIFMADYLDVIIRYIL